MPPDASATPASDLDPVHAVAEILALGDDRVIARGRHGGTGAVGPVDARFVHIWTVAEGKVSRYEQLADTRRFCDAVGK